VPRLLQDLDLEAAACQLALPDELVAHVDPQHLDRIVANLVLNALRHGAPPIRVRASGDDTRVELTVADNGSGLHPADLERVFDRFARGRDAEQSTGTGLGLAVVRELAVANGGEITYRRCADGPCFVLTLPRST
jgi:two-component system sensor histidine kinase MtrB